MICVRQCEHILNLKVFLIVSIRNTPCDVLPDRPMSETLNEFQRSHFHTYTYIVLSIVTE